MIAGPSTAAMAAMAAAAPAPAPGLSLASPCTRDASSSSSGCACCCAAAAAAPHTSSLRRSTTAQLAERTRLALNPAAAPLAAASSRRHHRATPSAASAAAQAAAEAAAAAPAAPTGRIISGKCFVVGDNIDTDQIIPAEYLTLVPSKPEEYEKLGSYAMAGLPATYGRFIKDGSSKSEYTVMIGGANFGCGSSREHAPVALGAAGVRAVVAESYARIFFRNSVATGELYPVEAVARICHEFRTGESVTVDLEHDLLVNHTTGKQYPLQSIGDAGPVIDAGGLFEYARKTGMIGAKAE